MEKLKDIKHFEIKCPVCGNTDFVLLFEEPPSMLSKQAYIIGCTKCALTLHFNPNAVSEVLVNEGIRKNNNEEIEELKKALEELKTEKENVLDSIEQLKLEREAAEDKSSLSKRIEYLMLKREQIEETIQNHNREIAFFEEETHSYENWEDSITII